MGNIEKEYIQQELNWRGCGAQVKRPHKKRTPISISIFSCGCQTQEISLTDIINLLSKAVYF